MIDITRAHVIHLVGCCPDTGNAVECRPEGLFGEVLAESRTSTWAYVLSVVVVERA